MPRKTSISCSVVSPIGSRDKPRGARAVIVLLIAILPSLASQPDAAETGRKKLQGTLRGATNAGAHRGREVFDKAEADLNKVNLKALRLAIRDLLQTFAEKYTDGGDYLQQVDSYKKQLPQIRQALEQGKDCALMQVNKILSLQREALLANPLLDFGRLLVIKRKPLGDPRRATGDKENDKGLGKFLGLPQQSSWQLHTMPNPVGRENEISILSSVRREGTLTTLFKPESQQLLNEMDLHFDADIILFSMPHEKRFWQLYEIDVIGEVAESLHKGEATEPSAARSTAHEKRTIICA